MSPKQTTKCRYCDWRCARFYGNKPQHNRLLRHVVEAHEAEFLQAHGVQSFEEYLDRCEAEDEYLDALMRIPL